MQSCARHANDAFKISARRVTSWLSIQGSWKENIECVMEACCSVTGPAQFFTLENAVCVCDRIVIVSEPLPITKRHPPMCSL